MKQKVKDTLMALAFYCALLAGPAVAVIGSDGRNQGNAGIKTFSIRPGSGYTGAHVPEVYVILFVLCMVFAGCVLVYARKNGTGDRAEDGDGIPLD